MPAPERWTPSGFTDHLGLHDFSWHPDGSVTVDLDLAPEHLNMGHIVHGGVLFSMLDSVMGGAVVATLDDHEWTATEAITTHFMRPAVTGRLTAKGWLERRGKLTAFVRGDVANADTGKTVASATGVWAIRHT